MDDGRGTGHTETKEHREHPQRDGGGGRRDIRETTRVGGRRVERIKPGLREEGQPREAEEEEWRRGQR